MDLADVLKDPPKPHRALDGQLMVMGLTIEALQFIYDNVDSSCATLETGCGLSTVVFALTGSRHWAISPSDQEFEIVDRYCRDRRIRTEQVTFVKDASESILPGLRLPALDLILIDGRHGFPAPYIDWFYTASRLKPGGHLVVDDVWLWSVQILHDFLMAQPEWRHVAYFERRTSVFKKLGEGSERLEWTQQPLVARGGRMKWIDGQVRMDPGPSALRAAFEHLFRGEILLLSQKVRRWVRRRLGGSGA
jgi:Methyltransferase domain